MLLRNSYSYRCYRSFAIDALEALASAMIFQSNKMNEDTTLELGEAVITVTYLQVKGDNDNNKGQMTRGYCSLRVV